MEFNEVAQPGQEVFDYTRCQRPDGSFYGTSGQCRKGSPVGAKEKPVKKARSKKTVEKALPKKPTDFDKGGTLKGDAERITGGPGREMLDRQIRSAKEAIEKYPNDDFFKDNLSDLEKKMVPFENTQKVLDGVVANVPKDTTVTVTPMGFIRTEYTTPGGNVVSTTFGRGSFNFQVNDSYDAGSVTQGRKEEMAVARQVQRVFNSHVKSVPERFVIQTSAHTDDGRGASRQRAYERMGFSKAEPGKSIYGRKEGNRIVPSNQSEEGLGSTLLSFAEKKNSGLVLWYVAVFGAPEKSIDMGEYDFARCQRPDGSFYGTSGTCRKGVQVGPKEKAALKKAAAAGNQKAKVALAVVEGKMTKAQAKKELSAPGKAESKPKATTKATKPKVKKEESPEKLKRAYKKKLDQAMKAMKNDDIDKALKLQAEANAISAKIPETTPKKVEKPKKKEKKEGPMSKLKDKVSSLTGKKEETGEAAATKQRERNSTEEGRKQVKKETFSEFNDMRNRAAPSPPDKEISAKARRSILNYTKDEATGRDYRSMNECSRNPPECTPESSKANKDMDAALRSAPRNTSGGSYFRGMDLEYSPALATQLENLKPGDTFTDPGFGSYSRRAKTAADFISSPTSSKGRNIVFESVSKNMRAIELYSDFESEQEGVLPRGVSQTVRSVKHVGNTTFITVD